MRENSSSSIRSWALVPIILLLTIAAWATQYKTKVIDFDFTHGASPQSALISDSAGNLYGTAVVGGVSSHCLSGAGCGVVFELTPTSNGWKATVLYDFCAVTNCTDGADPVGPLVFDAAGNLYGTTYGQVDLTG